MLLGLGLRSGGALLCQQAQGCDAMGQSGWGKFFGVMPVAWLGASAYAGFALISIAQASRGGTTLLRLQAMLLVAIAAAAAWFVAVQVMVFGKLCPTCCALHGLALSGCALIIDGRKQAARGVLFSLRRDGGRSRWLAPASGILTMGLLLLGSPIVWSSDHAPIFKAIAIDQGLLVSEPDSSGNMALLGREFEIPVARVPLLNPGSKGTAVLAVTNFACPHCVRMMRNLREVTATLPADSVSVYLLPVAADVNHAETQAILLAVWAAEPKTHEALVDALLAEQIKFTESALRAALSQRVSAATVAAWLSPAALSAARQQVVQNGQIVRRADESRGLQGFPQLWFAEGGIYGAAPDAAYYYDLLAKRVKAHRAMEPILSVVQAGQDFGKTPAGGMLPYSLELENVGQGALTVTGVQLPSGWKEHTKFPVTLAPREHLAVGLEIHSPIVAGAWRGQVAFLSNSAKLVPPSKFSGEALSVLTQPLSRIELPETGEDKLLADVSIPIRFNSDFEVGTAEVMLPGFVAAWNNVSNEAVVLKQTSLLPTGSHLGKLKVPVRWKSSSFDWQVPALEVAVAAYVSQPLIITPQRVVLPPMELDRSQEFVVAIRPRDGVSVLHPKVGIPEELRLAGVTATISEPDQRQGREITLHFPPKFSASANKGRKISLQSGLASGGSFELPLEIPQRANPNAVANRAPAHP